MESTSIHKVFVETKYTTVSDEQLLFWVKEAFPPFVEDDAIPFDKETSGDYKVHRFTGKPKILTSERKVPEMEIHRSPISKDEFIRREIETCKSDIVRKLLESPEFWDVSVSGDVYNNTIRVRFAAEIMECARPASGCATSDLADSMGALGIAMREAAGVMPPL